MELSPEQVRTLQLKQLEAMVEIDRVCREKSITYYLIGGTLLGAIRHQGFIPWDDDLDIGLPRADYDRFVELAQEAFGDKYFLQTYDTDPESYVPFAKVRVNNTIFKERSQVHMDCHHGIYVDVFPLDSVPDSRVARRSAAFYRRQLWRLISNKIGSDPSNKPWLVCMRRVVSRAIPLKWIIAALNFSVRKYESTSARCITNVFSPYGVEAEMLPVSSYGTPCEVEFEGCRFYAPAESKKLLKQVYGDYMKFPPLEDQVCRHPISEFSV